MYKVIILPLAKEDIREAAHWYNDIQKGLGKRFTKEIRTKILFIRKHPKIVSIRYGNVRCAVLDVFPFMLHFTIEEDKKCLRQLTDFCRLPYFA